MSTENDIWYHLSLNDKEDERERRAAVQQQASYHDAYHGNLPPGAFAPRAYLHFSKLGKTGKSRKEELVEFHVRTARAVRGTVLDLLSNEQLGRWARLPYRQRKAIILALQNKAEEVEGAVIDKIIRAYCW